MYMRNIEKVIDWKRDRGIFELWLYSLFMMVYGLWHFYSCVYWIISLLHVCTWVGWALKAMRMLIMCAKVRMLAPLCNCNWEPYGLYWIPLIWLFKLRHDTQWTYAMVRYDMWYLVFWYDTWTLDKTWCIWPISGFDRYINVTGRIWGLEWKTPEFREWLCNDRDHLPVNGLNRDINEIVELGDSSEQLQGDIQVSCSMNCYVRLCTNTM